MQHYTICTTSMGTWTRSLEFANLSLFRSNHNGLVGLTLIVLGGGGLKNITLSRSSITQRMQLDATLKYLCNIYFFPLLVYPIQFVKYCVV